MTYTAISVIGTEIHAVEDRIVCQWRLQCCRMVTTIYQKLMKPFLPTWQQHQLMIVSTIVIIQCLQWQMSLAPMDQFGNADSRLDASLLQRTLGSPKEKGHTSFAAASVVEQSRLISTPLSRSSTAHVFAHVGFAVVSAVRPCTHYAPVPAAL